LADCSKESPDMFVVARELPFKLVQFRLEVFMRHDYLPQLDKGSYDKYAHLYGTLAVQHIGCHKGTVFGKSVGQVFDILSSLQDHRL